MAQMIAHMMDDGLNHIYPPYLVLHKLPVNLSFAGESRGNVYILVIRNSGGGIGLVMMVRDSVKL